MILIERCTFKRCKFSSEREEELKDLKDILSFYVDGAFYSPLYKKGIWDGYTRFYDKNNFFDFGIVDEVIHNLDKLGIKWDFKDYVRPNMKLLVNEYKIDERMYYYQADAIEAFFQENIGILIVPTRGGKTFIASEMFRIIRDHDDTPILFVVDTEDLLNQARKDISGFMGISADEIGFISGKGYKPKQITIGMIQSLVSICFGTTKVHKNPTDKQKERFKVLSSKKRKRKAEFEKYLSTVGFLVVDEIQEYSSKKRINVLKKCKNVRYNLGISATPFRQENIIGNLTIKGFFGGIRYEIEVSELQKEGYLALDKVMLIGFEHKKKLMVDGYQDYLHQYIHQNVERNKILCDLIDICKRHRWKTLVLFNSKQHGYKISELSGAKFISGDDDTVSRDKAKDNFLRGRGKILLASNIYKKGVTLPEAEILILADGGYEGSNVIQKKGRVLGAVEGKTRALMFDIMDVGTKYFSNHSLNRLEVYSKEVGDDRIEVYELSEFEEMIESMKEWLDEQK